MIKINQKEEKLFLLIKVVVYVIAAFVLITSSRNERFMELSLLIAALVFNSFFRQLYLYERVPYLWAQKASIVLDAILIMLIGTMDSSINGASVYLYYVGISEAAIAFSITFSLLYSFLVLVLLTSSFIIVEGMEKAVTYISQVIPNMIVSIAFVFVMSYLVKLFLNERDVARRTKKELETAYEKLLESAANAQELAVEKERTRMAREIHDTLAHTLTAAVVQLEACKKLMNIDTERAREQVEKAQEVTREGLNEVKRTIKALRPQMLENKSFFGALDVLLQEAKRNTGVEVEFVKQLPEDFKLPSNIEVTMFRVIQESVTNAVRHGAADKVEIIMKYINGLLQLNITDNGKGCGSINKGYGLNGITERVELAKGSVSFFSSAGSGFKTEITIPLKGAEVYANKGSDSR